MAKKISTSTPGDKKNSFPVSEEIYRILAEHSLDGIFIISPPHGFDYVNSTFARMLGYEAEEICDKKFELYKHIHPEDRAVVQQRETLARAGSPVPSRSIIRIITRNEETKYVEENVVPLPGNKLRILGTIRDVTDRKKAEEDAQETMKKLRKVLGGTIDAIALTVEARDPFTSGHQRRVADLARTIATKMELPKDLIEGVRSAGVIHDLGKIGVPAEILSKPSKLSDTEFNLIKIHPQIGYDILKDIDFPWPIASIVQQHHERMDGSGYPLGRSDGEILLEARILAVADVVEAMSSHRPYRPSLGLESALEEISRNKGTLYDPAVVDTCLRLFQENKYEFK